MVLFYWVSKSVPHNLSFSSIVKHIFKSKQLRKRNKQTNKTLETQSMILRTISAVRSLFKMKLLYINTFSFEAKSETFH